MGSEFTVSAWKNINDGPFEYIEVYSGASWEDAAQAMQDQKTLGIKCIRLDWRP